MSESSRIPAVALMLSLTAAAGCSFSGSVGSAEGTTNPTPAPVTSSATAPSANAPPRETASPSVTVSPSVAASPSVTSIPSETASPSTQAPPTTASATEGTTSIRFPANTDTSTVTGTSQEGDQNTYTFDASEGQKVEMAITSPDDTVNYSLTSPDGTPLKTLSSEAREGSYPLDQSGTYVIALASPAADVDYSLELTIPSG